MKSDKFESVFIRLRTLRTERNPSERDESLGFFAKSSAPEHLIAVPLNISSIHSA